MFFRFCPCPLIFLLMFCVWAVVLKPNSLVSFFFLHMDKGQDRENVPEKQPSLSLKLVSQSETPMKETEVLV